MISLCDLLVKIVRPFFRQEMICVLLHFRDFSYCTLLRIFPIDLKVGEFSLFETIWLPLYPELERKKKGNKPMPYFLQSEKEKEGGRTNEEFFRRGEGRGEEKEGMLLAWFHLS